MCADLCKLDEHKFTGLYINKKQMFLYLLMQIFKSQFEPLTV